MTTLERRSLVPKTKYEDIALEVMKDEPFPIKLPDRTAKLIIESPSLAALDPDIEDFEGFQRRKAAHEARRAEMQKVAVETGGSCAPAESLGGATESDHDRHDKPRRTAREGNPVRA